MSILKMLILSDFVCDPLTRFHTTILKGPCSQVPFLFVRFRHENQINHKKAQKKTGNKLAYRP